MYLQTIVLITLMLLLDRAYAEQFSIQLEKDKATPTEYYEAISIYGNLYTTNNGKLTITHLGPYNNREIATDTLHELHVAGYTNAFINDYLNESQVVTKKRSTIENFDVSNLLDKKTLDKWNQLTAEQQSSIVYINGKLQVRNGKTLTPLLKF